MALSTSQIHELYTFTRKHYVEHYDLQTELVDHLANGIEGQILNNPKLSFKAALDLEFKKFGIFGFADVIGEKQKAMRNRYFKIIIGFFKVFFSFPKIMGTLTAIVLLFLFFNSIPPNLRYDISYGAFITIEVLLFYFGFRAKRAYTKKCKQTSKRWLLEDNIYNIGDILNGINLLFMLLSSNWLLPILSKENSGVSLASAAFLVCLGLLGFIVTYLLPKKAKELLSNTYPEYTLEM